MDRPDASFRFVGNDGPQLWFQTDLDAPRGRVVAIDLRRPDRADWVELIPERDEAIDSWVGAAAIGGRLVVGYSEDARIAVRVFDTDGRFQYRLQLPRLGSIWSGFVGRQDDSEAFYSLSGVADPGTIYRLDVESGRSTRFLRPELEYDPGDIVTRQVFFTSADGTRVPMYLAYRRGLDFGARPPVYMYGYGFGAWTAQPWFQAHIAVWLQMGGVWALPNIRGGGAYGEDWHQAGSRTRKQQAIDDYIAAGEWLVRNGYTTPQRLVANASSAGGAIAGAAVAQRPDLYGAAVLDFPVLDMLRYAEFTGARRWIPEYGTPDDPADFQALLASTRPITAWSRAPATRPPSLRRASGTRSLRRSTPTSSSPRCSTPNRATGPSCSASPGAPATPTAPTWSAPSTAGPTGSPFWPGHWPTTAGRRAWRAGRLPTVSDSPVRSHDLVGRRASWPAALPRSSSDRPRVSIRAATGKRSTYATARRPVNGARAGRRSTGAAGLLGSGGNADQQSGGAQHAGQVPDPLSRTPGDPLDDACSPIPHSVHLSLEYVVCRPRPGRRTEGAFWGR